MITKKKREFLSLSTGTVDRGNKVGLYNNSYVAVAGFLCRKLTCCLILLGDKAKLNTSLTEANKQLFFIMPVTQFATKEKYRYQNGFGCHFE